MILEGSFCGFSNGSEKGLQIWFLECKGVCKKVYEKEQVKNIVKEEIVQKRTGREKSFWKRRKHKKERKIVKVGIILINCEKEL